MTKKNSVFHKALSVVLTVVMVFGYVGLLSGVIGKDFFGTAQVAHAATASDYNSLKTAITNANSASGTTTIQLTANITGGSVAALPTINKNVILDLNGKSITWSYTGSCGDGDSNGTYQLPSENQGTNDREVNYLNKGMFNVSTSGSLQVINTSSTNSTVKVNTELTRNSSSHGWPQGGTTHGTTSSVLIYSEGTVIIGDKSNSGYNNFTLNATALVHTNGNKGGDNHNFHAHSLAFTVTVNNSNAKFFMYGGTLESQGKARCFYNGRCHMRVYSLNIENAYSAEVYGGDIKVLDARIEDETGTDADGDQCWASAIRCNTPNVYIFNVNASANGGSGNDSGDASLELSSVLALVSPGPLIYGGKFTSTGSKGSSDAGSVHNHTLQSANSAGWRIAIGGNICPSSSYQTGDMRYEEGSNTLTDVWFTVFHFGDTTTENGKYPWNYNTFRDYVADHTASNDAYFANSASHWNDGNNYGGATAGNYYRNGYRHTGWKGAKTPVDPSNASTSMTSTSQAGLNASNGGSLFLYPTWTETEYNITYDLNAGTGANGATNASGAPTKYKITSTSTLPRPTRNGYYFTGWLLTQKAYDKIGSGTIESSIDHLVSLDMSQSYDSRDPWSVGTIYNPKWNGSAYSAGQSLNGKNGHIWLQAQWSEIPYTATFNYDNIPAGATGLAQTPNGQASYNINSTFTFPQNATKPYYTFNGTNNGWKVTGPDGNWSNGATFNAGSSTSVGKFGNPTFTAQYTPIQYTITFVPNNNGSIPSNYDSQHVFNEYHYTYESTDTLPSVGRLGYTFGGWKPTSTVTEEWDSTQIVWDETATYTGTSLNHKHGDVTLVAQWNTVSSKVHYVLGAGESLTGSALNPSYSFQSENNFALDTANKTGYTFVGWRIIPPSGSDNTYYDNFYSQYEADNNVEVPDANRWTMSKGEGETFYSLASGNFVLPQGKIGDVWLAPEFTPITYTLTYNANGGSACAPITYTIESNLTLASTSLKGYDFSGWTAALTNAGSGEVYNWTADSYDFGDQLTGMYGNVTLTAQKEPAHYTITLDVNGGDSLANNTRTYTIEVSTELPANPTRTGYTFLCWQVAGGDDLANPSTWYDDPDNTRQYTDTLPDGCYGNVKLIAQWVHTPYAINKDGFGEQTYYIDVPFTLGGATQPGYTFVNWNVVNNIGNWVKDDVYTATQQISGMWGNVTLHPNFTPIPYTITYTDKDGNTTSTASYTIETPVTLPDGSQNGYDFGGWVVSGLTGGGRWVNGDKMPQGEYGTGYYGNVTLTPDLTPVNYTVKFISDGGTTFPDLPYTIEGAAEGFENTLPEPTKTGYNFAGWKVTTAAGSWTDGAVIPAGTSVVGKWGRVTLTAQWSAKSIPVKYIVGNTTLYPDGISKNGTFNEIAPDLTDAEKAKPADAQYTYTFDHWEPALGRITREDPQYVYTAVYSQTVNKYTVTWMIPSDVNGTPGSYEAQESDPIEYGNAPVYNDGVNPTLDSANLAEYTWRFAGWSLTEGGEKLESLPAVTGNATYYALFTKVLRPEIVNWVINGVTNQEEWGIGELPEWRHDTPTKPDENGYRFIFTGWDSDPVPVVQHGGPYTYTAVFDKVKQDYTITLNLNGGETADPLTYAYQMGNTVTFPAPERTGYTFAGWKLDEAVGSWPADTVVPAGEYATGSYWGNVSFTAQWTPVSYTIKFNAASEDDVLPAALTYTIESDTVIPAATREGHTLSGWIVSVGGGNWTQGATIAAAYQLAENYGDVTLTPVWQVRSYTIHWISGDYEQTSEAEYGSAILAYTPISKMGYTADWDNEVPATMPAEDLTFYAVYTPVQYYIRLNVNGGSPLENFYYTIDGNNVLPTPTREGATFRGWKVAAAQGNWSRNTIMAGGASLNGKYGNVSLTAQWELEQHTVTWVAGDVTKETIWLYGAIPSYDGTPYKSPDEHNSYRFIGWDKEIVAVTEDVTYEALFEATERVYTVLWVVDGTTVLRQEYSYGDMPEFAGETPTRPSTTEFDFTFSGWSPAVAEVTKDVTYTAQFDVFTKLQSLALEVSSMFLEIGAGETLGVTLYPANASVRDVLWTSQDQNVATIDANGKITAVNPGVSVIKVASVDNSRSAYCVVTVSPRHTKYVEITAGGISTTQLAGAMLQLSATIQPDNATDTGIRWTSGDVSVATVDSNGLVKYVGVGETDITAVASDGFSKGSIHVVTTTDETEVENDVKTYLVTFGEFYPGFKFTENGEHYTAGRLFVAEGETIRFKLDVQNSRQGNYSVYSNMEKISCDADYWYTLDNIQNNLIIRFADSPAGIGAPEEEENGGDSGAKLTFFERLAAFFRKIVEFFRGLFNR